MRVLSSSGKSLCLPSTSSYEGDRTRLSCLYSEIPPVGLRRLGAQGGMSAPVPGWLSWPGSNANVVGRTSGQLEPNSWQMFDLSSLPSITPDSCGRRRSGTALSMALSFNVTQDEYAGIMNPGWRRSRAGHYRQPYPAVDTPSRLNLYTTLKLRLLEITNDVVGATSGPPSPRRDRCGLHLCPSHQYSVPPHQHGPIKSAHACYHCARGGPSGIMVLLCPSSIGTGSSYAIPGSIRRFRYHAAPFR